MVVGRGRRRRHRIGIVDSRSHVVMSCRDLVQRRSVRIRRGRGRRRRSVHGGGWHVVGLRGDGRGSGAGCAVAAVAAASAAGVQTGRWRGSPANGIAVVLKEREEKGKNTLIISMAGPFKAIS